MYILIFIKKSWRCDKASGLSIIFILNMGSVSTMVPAFTDQKSNKGAYKDGREIWNWKGNFGDLFKLSFNMFM